MKEGATLLDIIKKVDFGKEILPLIVGAFALFLATPPNDFYPFSFFAIFVALLSLKIERKGFLKGFFFGFIYHLLTMYWIAYVLKQYGNLPTIVSTTLLLILVAYLSLYPAVYFKIYERLNNRMPEIFHPIFFALLWVLLEIVRANILTGFPWMLIGYTQHNFLPFALHSKYVTIYGIGFFIIFVNITLLNLMKYKSKKSISIVILAILMLSYFIYSGEKEIEKVKDSFQHKKAIKVRAVQGNIDQSKKWDKKLQSEIISKYLALSDGNESELIIWPETALPFVYGVDGEWTEYFRDKIANKDFYLLTGFVSIGYDSDGKPGFTNSAGLFYKGSLIGRYDKMHLVPFGEYVPLKKVLFFVNKLVEAAGDFLSGTGIKVIKAKDMKIGILICYEAIFPEISNNYIKNGVNLIVNITNDAWFGKSSAPFQHLAMSRFRAMENEVYVVRVANTGISCIITPWGEVLYRTELFRDATFDGVVYLK